jgi:molecular chaperone DnaJ
MVQVKVPPGVESGVRLRLRGEGEGGYRGGPSGDLYVRLHVQPHEFFDRDGDNLHCRVSISFLQAILGDSVEVPSLEGSKTLSIEPGTQPGTVIRFAGDGVPRLKGYGRGDLFVELQVKIPTKISPEQEELLKAYRELEKAASDQKGRKWPWQKRKEHQNHKRTAASPAGAGS